MTAAGESTQLEGLLAAAGREGPAARVSAIDRRPLVAHSSHRLEELEVTLGDATRLELVLKHTGDDGMLPGALSTRPRFLADPLREVAVYTDLLSGGRLGVPRCYGVIDRPGAGQALVLERVMGPNLGEVALPAWLHAARWLGRFHAEMQRQADAAPGTLLRYDPPAWRRWMPRAERFARAISVRARLEGLATAHDTAVEYLASLPVTVVHGDFHASNVLVAKGPEGLRICPIDWELAGVGPGLLDLAALTSGPWAEPDREALVAAYLEACGGLYGAGVSVGRALAASRLVLAVQWLGWSPGWEPPADHRQDWLDEAVRSARELES